ncbi:ERF family protein [Heyndrickxia sp. MSNUG]|uniref:ERF family protein n=1 Tax=Heyndrickxia sp. MSNUG TaxID=3136677 RepID=UPI003C30700E
MKELCSENGISYTQSIVSSDAGIGVQTMIMHISGEYIIHEPFYLPVAQKTAQSGASSATYARRYALSAAFGIVADEDDDGNFASRPKEEKNLDF